MQMHRYIELVWRQGRIQGGLWGLETPLQKYIREAKRIMYWYKTRECSVLYEMKQPISSKGLHPPRPLLHIWLKTLYLLKYALNLGLGMILVLYY